VPDEVASARLGRLLALQEEIQAEAHRALVGREFEILVEGTDRKAQSRGRTPCNRIVHVEGSDGMPGAGSYATVEIVRGLPNSLIGRVAGRRAA
jgi:tRNA-2-methylthio-N6-dimethylallyladenosine synthase